MERRPKILENEKNDVQKTLEKEIDRRSIEWASLLEKFQFEERRMRKRMKDLAERNVELLREVSSNKQEINANTQVIDDLRTRLRDAENEIMELRESLSQSIEKTEQAEND
ncbi:hypothetical protein SUGI_1096920 [Cryptomeria japonica]|nr:hypothetical protein SUGI_1096920 [Cryptomeria japonica]